MNFGATFRKIRKQRKISLQELAGDDLSYSALATFERDECRLSFETLSLLLRKLQLSIDEFYGLCTANGPATEFEIFSKQAADCLYRQDAAGLGCLKATQQEKYKELGLCYYRCNAIICQVTQKIVDPNQPNVSKEDQKFMLDYLWNVEIWTKYELSVLNYSLPLQTIPSLLSFINEIYASLPADFLLDKLYRYKFNLLNGMLSLLIDQNELELAEKWLLTLKARLAASQDFYSMLYLYQLELILKKKKQPSAELEGLHQELRQTLINMGAANYAAHFQQAWQDI